MNVTLLADASWCPETRAAGYGFWIASSRGRMSGGGSMTTRYVVTNIAAEMMAVANALHHAVLQELVQERDRVLVQTDCMGAILGFQGLRLSLADQEMATVKYVSRLTAMYNLSVRYRHVKAHTGRSEPRYVANHLCDQRAKEGMRAARLRERSTYLKDLHDQAFESRVCKAGVVHTTS